MNIKKLFSACLIVCVSVLAYGESAPVKIGWAMESIDPGRSSVMPGYGSFRPSYGCADPIYATCLVLVIKILPSSQIAEQFSEGIE